MSDKNKKEWVKQIPSRNHEYNYDGFYLNVEDEDGYKRIFFSKEDVVEFANNIKTIAESILIFISKNVKISSDDFLELMHDKANVILNDLNFKGRDDLKDVPSYEKNTLKKYLERIKSKTATFTIKDIVSAMMPTEVARITTTDCLHSIDIDQKSKFVRVRHDGTIRATDIKILEDILAQALFDYYFEQLSTAKQQRENLLEMVKRAEIEGIQNLKNTGFSKAKKGKQKGL